MTSVISGVILAGGANKRFGGITKTSLKVDGEKIISRITSTIGVLFEEIIIVTNTPEEFREFRGCKIIEDQFKNAGPLGGIHAALQFTSSDAVFVFAGDMPFLDSEIIENMIAEFSNSRSDVLIPVTGEMIEPLHAVYRKTVQQRLERYLSEGQNRAVRDFISQVDVEYFELEVTAENLRAFTNINQPSDL